MDLDRKIEDFERRKKKTDMFLPKENQNVRLFSKAPSIFNRKPQQAQMQMNLPRHMELSKIVQEKEVVSKYFKKPAKMQIRFGGK